MGPAFLSGVGVKEFAAIFAAVCVHFLLCKDFISFVNDHCISGPRYLDQKSDQLWNYELLFLFVARGDWLNWNKMLPQFFPKIDVSSVELRWADWVKKMEPRYKSYWLDNGIYHAITCSTT